MEAERLKQCTGAQQTPDSAQHLELSDYGLNQLESEINQSLPTDAKEREKERRTAEKEAGIERVVVKRKKVLEDHHDDCGEDFGPLGDDFLSYFDAEADDEEQFCALSWDFGMNGSDFIPTTQDEMWEGKAPMVFDSFETFTQWDESRGRAQAFAYDDVAQLCGGNV